MKRGSLKTVDVTKKNRPVYCGPTLYDLMDSTYEFYWLDERSYADEAIWKLTKADSDVIRSNRDKYFPRKS